MTAKTAGRGPRALRTFAVLTAAGVLTVVAVVAATKLSRPARPVASHSHAPPSTPAAPTASRSSTPASPWLLVSVGDSVPAGSDCSCAPFPQVYARQVARHAGVAVRVRNNAAPGQTSGQLREALRTSSALRGDIAAATIVTVTIGANDFGFGAYRPGQCDHLSCYGDGLDQLAHNLDAIFSSLQSLTAGHPAAVRITGYWEIWRDGAVGRRSGATYMRVGDALTRRVNDVIAGRAAAHGLVYVDLYRAFHGPDGDRDDTSLLAADGDHPSRIGHEVIGDALLATGLAPLL